MKATLSKFSRLQLPSGVLVLAWVFGFGGCATSEVAPTPPATLSPPDYIQQPHPMGYQLHDLRAIFTDARAIGRSELSSCDSDYRKLTTLTQSEDELKQGARELVRGNPVLYHWCFYGKVLDLDDKLKGDTFIDERQKDVLHSYSFLVPMARAFAAEFKDSRYLRWAVRHYRHLSEVVFFRKVELSPRMTAELVEVSNPFGAWRPPVAEKPILEKYLAAQPSPIPSPAAPAVEPASIIESTQVPAPAPATVTPESNDLQIEPLIKAEPAAPVARVTPAAPAPEPDESPPVTEFTEQVATTPADGEQEVGKQGTSKKSRAPAGKKTSTK